MRRALFLILFTIVVVAAQGQGQQVAVVLKSGSTVVGTMQSIDVNSGITLVVGGVTTEIAMSEITKVEPLSTVGSSATTPQSYSSPFAALPSNQYGDYVITDYASYPESFTITVAGQTFTMLLVRGGVFNMGYDGKGSIFMDTEPVHKVAVSSFYVSKEYCNNRTASRLTGTKHIRSDSDKAFITRDWEWAKGVAAAVARDQQAPYRLLTEAEWEYAAILPTADYTFHEIIADPFFARGNRIGEWCSDYWGKYRENSEVNPQGPSAGTKHVARCYTKDEYRWCRDRKKVNKNTDPNKFIVRIAISAESVPIQQ